MYQHCVEKVLNSVIYAVKLEFVNSDYVYHMRYKA